MNFRPHRPFILYTTPLDLSPRVPAPVAQRFVFIRRCKSKERRWLRSHNREFTVETEFPPKVQAKRASNSETSCWLLRVEKESGMEGCPKRESKESLPLRGLIRQWIFIRSLRISYSFKYWGCLSCPRLMTDSKWFAFCLHRIFVANLFFTW